jgi:hypothetical protein
MIRTNPDIRRYEAEWGIHFDGAMDYLPDAYRNDYNLAMDAAPTLVTAPNGGIPAFLTTYIDPKIYKILTAPNKGAEILGEVKVGTWLDQTAMFPSVERTGEVSTYGDRNQNGRAGLNTNFPQRQSYLAQVILDWGQLEMERAGLARIGWAAGVREAGIMVLSKYINLTYFFGVGNNLENYGIVNDPNLTAYLTPAPKAAGGNTWIKNGAINATANEVYADIQALWIGLVSQAGGLVDQSTKVKLCMSPTSELALTATNSFNVNVSDLLKKNFPNMTVVTAVQYGAATAQNSQGVAGGNVVQMIAESVEGQDTGYCAFNEKLRSFPVKVELSSFKQKMVQGSWGAVYRMPALVSQMQGV